MRSLIEANLRRQPEDVDRLEQAKRAERVRIRGIFWGLERDLHMALGGEIVDFGWPHILHNADEIGRIGHIAVMQEKADIAFMQVVVEMIDPLGVERRRASLDAVNHVTLAEQKLRQIRAILPGYAGNECDTVVHRQATASRVA